MSTYFYLDELLVQPICIPLGVPMGVPVGIPVGVPIVQGERGGGDSVCISRRLYSYYIVLIGFVNTILFLFYILSLLVDIPTFYQYNLDIKASFGQQQSNNQPCFGSSLTPLTYFNKR